LFRYDSCIFRIECDDEATRVLYAYPIHRSLIVLTATDLRGASVSIRSFFSGHAFEPETIRSMSIALERACEEMGLRPGNDAATAFVATKIIELAKQGIRSPDQLVKLTLQDMQTD
jgi:hypothetical protein